MTDELKHPTEAEMRDAEAPRPETIGELSDYIATLTDRPHDYGTCCYAMSLAAVAAFNHVAGKLGVTGFQASCADMDIIRRTRLIKGPFMMIDLERALYPQYDLAARLQEFIVAQAPWLKAEAEKRLAANAEQAHPDVVAHWKKLASA